jgi:transposase-like protein
MSTKRKTFSKAEKITVALEAIKGESTLAQISSKHGVHSTQINSWKKQALDYLKEAFSNKINRSVQQYESESAKLYEQIGRLKIENDFLKKKL